MSETIVVSIAAATVCGSECVMAYSFSLFVSWPASPLARHADRSAAQLAFIEVPIGLSSAAERIPVFDRLDAAQAGQLHDLAEVGGASVHARRQLRSPWDVTQSEVDLPHGRADHGQPPESCQCIHAQLQRGFGANAIEHARRAGTGRHLADPAGRARVARDGSVCAV